MSKAFGLNVIKGNEVRPFVQQLRTSDEAMKLDVSFGNLVHKQSDLPPNEIDNTDLNLRVKLR